MTETKRSPGRPRKDKQANGLEASSPEANGPTATQTEQAFLADLDKKLWTAVNRSPQAHPSIHQ